MHDAFMDLALQEAREAALQGEVPVGAVLVRQDQVWSRGRNRRHQSRSVLGHAEIVAIEEANQRLGDWRLDGCTLYVTLEPCPMCMGAVLQSRVSHLVFGAADPQYGCAGSVVNLASLPGMGARVEVTAGVRAPECASLLEDFFKAKRKKGAP